MLLLSNYGKSGKVERNRRSPIMLLSDQLRRHYASGPPTARHSGLRIAGDREANLASLACPERSARLILYKPRLRNHSDPIGSNILLFRPANARKRMLSACSKLRVAVSCWIRRYDTQVAPINEYLHSGRILSDNQQDLFELISNTIQCLSTALDPR